jgi:putative tricarboxylic transport membrane protein
MLTALFDGLSVAFSPAGMLYTAIGSALGYLFGFLPGLTGSVALSLLIPVTFGLNAQNAMMLLAGTL